MEHCDDYHSVGYEDISPETMPGRIIAVLLMIFGIGFIGMLTGTITTFFTRKVTAKTKSDELNDMISRMSEIQIEKMIHFGNQLIEKDRTN